MNYELIAMGRCGVDIYPLQHGVGLEEVRTFEKFLGGSAMNVAVAAARYGRSSAIVTKTGTDAFGRFVAAEASRLGVDARYITAVTTGPPTPVVFCEIHPPDHFPLSFYRYPTAPDLLLEDTDVPLDAVERCRVLWLTLTGFSQEPSRATHHRALEARRLRGHTILDLDYRPQFWQHETTASAEAQRALEAVTIAVGNREECSVAVGESDPDRAADALLDRGLELAVVKQGPRGVLAATREERVLVRPFPVRVVNGLGAGDAFGGALVHGLLCGWDLRRTIEFANVAGAIVAGRLACSEAMPSEQEVERTLGAPQQEAS